MQSPTYAAPLELNTDKNVQGWLMGVPGYRDGSDHGPSPVDETQARPAQQRRKSTSSTASDDSINLDDLIKANNILNVNDETDLPNLSALDLDDSKEDFWHLDNKTFLQPRPHLPSSKPLPPSSLRKPPMLPVYTTPMLDTPLELKPPPLQRFRSPSINSDDHQSNLPINAIPLYNRMDSSPRTASRMSNYSTTSTTSSSHTTSALPRPQKANVPTPSRSNTSRHLPTPPSSAHATSGFGGTTSRLAQRSSHIPAPKPPPALVGNLSSSRSTGIPTRSPSRLAIPTVSKKPPARATHIPTVRGRPASPRPSPIRNSVFGTPRDDLTSSSSGLRTPSTDARHTLPRFGRK
ncbi:hypothetical protein DM01DRAFT_1383579 [Hesseltinella vesiculosa]|uniref:Uncharacterized protein n=1 Tax=Hesseltinella vesiculosa TaxID=101127 RepID=A0A1X2GH22_9FUNG|nr:hypothetical protein DM01DRAFT_1383579 [Hesseltinella vesiculosa]